MPYQLIHSENLTDIIELIKTNRISGTNEALDKFAVYLETIQEIDSFEINNWPQDWRQKVWKLGAQFKEQNPQLFLKLIDEKLSLPAIKNEEVLEFIRSEIAFNFLPDKECKRQIERLIGKYQLNPEFRHTLGHYYAREGDRLHAIEQYKLALKIEPSNKKYLTSRFNNEYYYLNQLISKGEYKTGQEYVKSIVKENFYIEAETIYYNSFIDIQTRISDHLIFQNKIVELENEFRNKMNEELTSERKRIIEILGFFSAIVAFILSTVSIGKNFSFIEAIYFLVALGLILILFSVSLSTLLNSTKTGLFKDAKFWILILGLILLFFFIIKADTISNIISQLIL
jgi:tetratricopeptide (TPR) repeat protein